MYLGLDWTSIKTTKGLFCRVLGSIDFIELLEMPMKFLKIFKGIEEKMKRLRSWLRDNFLAPHKQDWGQMSTSIQKMAAQNRVNRRKITRILYPHANFSTRVPQFFYQNKAQKASDLSLGGVCLVNDSDQFGLQIGSDVELQLAWMGEERISIFAKAVAQSFQKTHFQFLNLPTEIYVKMSLNLKSGMSGRKFQRSLLNDSGPMQTNIRELWIGLNDDKVITSIEPGLKAEITFYHLVFKVYTNNKVEAFQRSGQSMPLNGGLLTNCLLLLCNIPSPSSAILGLEKTLESRTTRVQVPS
jgi:hypothetical protein